MKSNNNYTEFIAIRTRCYDEAQYIATHATQCYVVAVSNIKRATQPLLDIAVTEHHVIYKCTVSVFTCMLGAASGLLLPAARSGYSRLLADGSRRTLLCCILVLMRTPYVRPGPPRALLCKHGY